MSFLYRLGMMLIASLFLRTVAAQTCYYPDGLTVSEDVACNSNAGESSCCPEGSFCMDNGLCFEGGIISRGSCTDQSWKSAECAAYCVDDEQSNAVSLTACDADTRTFTCGLNNTQCLKDDSTFVMTKGNSLVLRPSQIEELTDGNSDPVSSSHNHGTGTVVGVALGIGLPLSFALVMTLLVLRKERQRYALRSMFEQHDMHTSDPRTHPRRSFSTLSKSGTMTTIESTSTYNAQQPRALLERYGYHKGYYAHEGDLGVPVFELPSGPLDRDERVEAP